MRDELEVFFVNFKRKKKVNLYKKKILLIYIGISHLSSQNEDTSTYSTCFEISMMTSPHLS